MLTVTIKNSKDEEIVLRNDLWGKLLDIKGLSELPVEVQSEKAPFQDGSTYLTSLLEDRDIEIKFAITYSSEAEKIARRSLISKVLSPKNNPISIIFEKSNYKRMIEAYVDSYPIMIKDFKGRQHFSLSLIATKPEWKDLYFTVSDLEKILRLFEFELEIFSEGIELSSYSGGNITIENAGDVSTPIYVEIYGPVTSPKLINLTTGEFIELETPLLAGETMVITTEFGNKRADKINNAGEKTSAFEYLNLDSTFFELIPGKNIISFDAAAGSSDAKIKILFKNKYLMV